MTAVSNNFTSVSHFSTYNIRFNFSSREPFLSLSYCLTLDLDSLLFPLTFERDTKSNFLLCVGSTKTYFLSFSLITWEKRERTKGEDPNPLTSHFSVHNTTKETKQGNWYYCFCFYSSSSTMSFRLDLPKLIPGWNLTFEQLKHHTIFCRNQHQYRQTLQYKPHFS